MFSTKCFHERVFCFKHWRHTQFSVFFSIGKAIRIGVLPLVYLILTFGQHAFAQADSTIEQYHQGIDSVLIRTVRQHALTQIPRSSVQKLTAAQLQQTGKHSVQDALDFLPGVDIRQRGPLGIQADLAIRGGSFDQVLVLIDGIDVTDAQTGHHSLAIPIRPEALLRLELLSSPGARIYSPGAYAGAINLVPKKADSTHFLLSTQLGQYALKDIFAGFAHRTGRVALTAYAAGSSTDGFTTNTDHTLYNGYIASQIDIPNGQLRLQMAHLGKEFGAQAYYTPLYPEQYEAVKTSLATLAYLGYANLWNWEASIGYRHLTDRFQLFRYNAPQWYKGHNYHQTQLLTARLRVDYTTRYSRTQLAIMARYDNILSTQLGHKQKEAQKIPGVTSQKYTHLGERTNLTATLEETLTFGKLTLTLGGMTSYNSSYRFVYAYGGDINYAIAPTLSTNLAINSAYRLPTFTDLYYNSPTRAGNEYLRPEEAITFEGGFRFQSQQIPLQANFTVFFRKGHNIIDWVQETPNNPVWNAQNHRSLSTLGGEFSAEYAPKFSFLHHIGIAYAYSQHLDKQKESRAASYALDNLKHLLTLRAAIPCTHWITFTPALRYAQRAGSYPDLTAKQPIAYPANICIDLRTSLHIAAFDFFLEANNLLDAQRIDLGNVPLPGRWLLGGMQYNINW